MDGGMAEEAPMSALMTLRMTFGVAIPPFLGNGP